MKKYADLSYVEVRICQKYGVTETIKSARSSGFEQGLDRPLNLDSKYPESPFTKFKETADPDNKQWVTMCKIAAKLDNEWKIGYAQGIREKHDLLSNMTEKLEEVVQPIDRGVMLILMDTSGGMRSEDMFEILKQNIGCHLFTFDSKLFNVGLIEDPETMPILGGGGTVYPTSLSKDYPHHSIKVYTDGYIHNLEDLLEESDTHFEVVVVCHDEDHVKIMQESNIGKKLIAKFDEFVTFEILSEPI